MNTNQTIPASQNEIGKNEMTNATQMSSRQSQTSPKPPKFVIYRGKRYEVDSNCYRDTNLLFLKSRFSGGSSFYAKKDECRIATKAA